MGFAMNTHYCGGRAVESSLSIGIEHLDCGMPAEKKKKSNCEDEQLDKQSCCKNLHQVMEVDENQDTVFPVFNLNQTLLISFVYSFVFNFLNKEGKHVSVFPYPPPLLEKDSQVLFQTFLI